MIEENKYKSDRLLLCCLITAALVYMPDILLGAFNVFPDTMAKTDPDLYSVGAYAESIATWIAFIGYALIVKCDRPLLKELSWNNGGRGTMKFFAGLALGFAMNGICILAARINGDIYMTFDDDRFWLYLIAFGAVFIQSSSEELAFRWFFYRKLKRRYKNPWVTILITSFGFACVHLMNDGITVLAFTELVLSGLVFALIIVLTDSIWMSSAVHAAWNFTQNLLFGLPNSGNVLPISIFKLDASSATDSFFYNVGFGIEGCWFSVIIEIITAGMLLYLCKKYKKL